MNPTLGIFFVILLITLGITYWAAKRTSTTADFYAADSRLTDKHGMEGSVETRVPTCRLEAVWLPSRRAGQ